MFEYLNRVPVPKWTTRRPLFAVALLCCTVFASCTALMPRNTASTSFLAQKGKLPWPSEGTIAESFGMQVNPVYSTRTPNPGILIATSSAARVRSVHAGEVESMRTMPGFGQVVTIKHGNYSSVYGNLSSLHVSPGMRVETGQLIGFSGTADAPKGQAVFFALFDGGIETNPESWLRRR